MNRTELLSQVRAGRERFEKALAQVDNARMAEALLYKAWSVKDLLAHVGEWEQWAAHIVDDATRGKRPANAIEPSKLDEINAELKRKHHDRSLPDVRQFERDAYDALLVSVSQATDDDLFNPQHFDWANGQPLANWVVWNTYEHYDEHLVELNALIARK